MTNTMVKHLVCGNFIIMLLLEVANEKGYVLSNEATIRILNKILDYDDITKDLVSDILDKNIKDSDVIPVTYDEDTDDDITN